MDKVTGSTKYGSKKRAARFENTCVYFFLTLGAVVMIIPLVWMFESSLKTPGQFLTTQLDRKSVV